MTSPPALARALLAAAALATLAPLSGCGSEPRGSVPLTQFADVRRHEIHVGLDDAVPPEGVIGTVMAARVTDSGRHVVVLDNLPPFVKVYDRAGRFRAAFLRSGDGPGEARAPTALAVSGDSLVLIGEPGRGLMVFDLTGRLRAQARVDALLPLAAAAPCPGEWLVYGPRLESGGAGGAAWLHRVRFTAPGAVEVGSSMREAMPRQVGAGLAYGLVADGDGAVLRHGVGERPRVVRVPCSGESRVLHADDASAEQPASTREGRSKVTSLKPGMRAPGGVASLGGSVVFGERVFVGSQEDRLDMTMLAKGAPRTLSIARDYVLRDSRPGVGVLLSTADPVPQVFLVKPEEFLGIFADE